MSRKAAIETAVAGKTGLHVPSGPGARHRLGGGLWWGGLCCGGLIVLAPGSAILLLGMLLPLVLVAAIPDRHAGPKVVQASLLFGLAASVHGLRALWQDEATPALALAMLRQPQTLFTAWSAIAGGWLMSECAGLVLRLSVDFAAASQRRSLMQQIRAIEEEWGPMPASAPLPPLR